MTKTEIVTALIAAMVSKDYNGERLHTVHQYHVDQAVSLANKILASTVEDTRDAGTKARQEMGMIVEDKGR